jgi:hypothetical protein
MNKNFSNALKINEINDNSPTGSSFSNSTKENEEYTVFTYFFKF